jgi:hypothetical protein
MIQLDDRIQANGDKPTGLKSGARATSIEPGRIRGGPGMFRHVYRTPELQNKAQGLSQELQG